MTRPRSALVLTRWQAVRSLMARRELNWLLMTAALLGFLVAILAGLFGSPTGSANFGIVFVWIVWWGLLMVLLLPLGGRLWCLICPVPAPGEWLQRGAVVEDPAAGAPAGAEGRRWPAPLRGIWLQSGMFLAMALFSAMIFTRPRVSGWVLLGFLAGGIGLALCFERRSFCRYVCPLGGFIGIYSLASPLALRVGSADVCREHRTRDCYVGNAAGYGCPWLERPWQMERSAYCGLCGECFRTCPKDNIELLLRLPGGDLLVPTGWRLDEAYKAFILLACGAIYPLVLLGPWGWLKDWANLVSWRAFAMYAGGFLAACLLVVPGVHLLLAAAVRQFGGLRAVPLRPLFTALAYPLVPLGLAAWVAFTLSFVLANISYALPVLSDPFGWGWNLFGTRDMGWTPLLGGWLPGLQALVLIGGLVASIVTADAVLESLGARVRWGLVLTAVALTAETVGLLWLHLGVLA